MDKQTNLSLTFDVWVTKYALTKGVYREHVRTTTVPTLVVSTTNQLFCIHKPFWHMTKAEAVAHAEILRAKRIKALQLQLTKLQRMQF